MHATEPHWCGEVPWRNKSRRNSRAVANRLPDGVDRIPETRNPGTGAGAQLLGDALQEMLDDAQEETEPARAESYREQLRIDRLYQLDSVLSEYRGAGHWGPEGLSGFSLRFSLGIAQSDQSHGGQVILETLVRDRVLLVQISNTFAMSEGPATEYRIMQADGKPLPDWLDKTNGTLLIGEHPADVEVLRLRVIAILSDGTTITREVEIRTSTGEIQALLVERRTEVPRMFSDQLESGHMLSPREIDDLADALE